MTARPTIKQVGGDRLAALLKGIRDEKGRDVAVEVGFFETARYPSGQSVAAVAAVHELGAPRRNIPSRPFFRNAIPAITKMVVSMVRSDIDPETMRISNTLLKQIGVNAVALIQKSIVDLKVPDLAESTKASKRAQRKRPPYNPLIDTGKLRLSTTWKVRRGRVRRSGA